MSDLAIIAEFNGTENSLGFGFLFAKVGATLDQLIKKFITEVIGEWCSVVMPLIHMT